MRNYRLHRVVLSRGSLVCAVTPVAQAVLADRIIAFTADEAEG